MFYPREPSVGLSWSSPAGLFGGHRRRWGFTQAAGVSGGVLGFEDHSEPPRTLRDQVTQL